MSNIIYYIGLRSRNKNMIFMKFKIALQQITHMKDQQQHQEQEMQNRGQ